VAHHQQPIGPCEWCIPDPKCCPQWDAAEPEDRERAKSWASFLLWSATGRQFGRCETRLRPCRKRCDGTDWPPRCSGQMATAGMWVASVVAPPGGAWAGVTCGCGQGDACSCTEVCKVNLPGVLPEPVRVDVDGWEIPLDTFRVDDGRWLVWEQPCAMPCECEPVCCDDSCGLDVCSIDDRCNCAPPILTCFPACQDLSKPAGCKGTWEITYTHGNPVPPEGSWAGSELACEILKSFNCAPGECRLPSNVVAMTRGGVSMEFANNGSVTAANGRTLRFGIPIVDMWVQAVNPYGVTGQAQVWSPDIDYGRIQTWP
jgi:hypothetical protein